MAIVQISRITQRKGLQENLPQLAGAEFGWSIDQRKLYIGNGLLEEGAPVIGNTEILTEFSDLSQFLPTPTTTTLYNNTVSQTVFITLPTSTSTAMTLNYRISRSNAVRQGTLTSTVGSVYEDNFVQNLDTGIILTAAEIGSNLTISYTATNTGVDATISYFLQYIS